MVPGVWGFGKSKKKKKKTVVDFLKIYTPFDRASSITLKILLTPNPGYHEFLYVYLSVIYALYLVYIG